MVNNTKITRRNGNSNRQGNGNGNGSGKGGKKKVHMQGVQNFRGITQSVALSVNNAFGDSPKTSTIAKGLDAFNECHVPLPRAVGGYTTVRTTQVLSGTEVLRLFGPVEQQATGGMTYSDICCLSSVNSALAINAANNTKREAFATLSSSSWDNCRFTPAAFSIQIMNPEALQTTTGIVYVGRTKQQINVGGDTRTYDTLANDLVSYTNPRLCAAGKLALRGVQVDAIPYDMQALADFRVKTTSGAANFTWADDNISLGGFAPIFVYNPDGIDLQFLVCCEWRVRFDPANPAYATHSYHRPSTAGYWDSVLKYASALGNGAMDIAEKSLPYLMNYAMGSEPSRLTLTNG